MKTLRVNVCIWERFCRAATSRRQPRGKYRLGSEDHCKYDLKALKNLRNGKNQNKAFRNIKNTKILEKPLKFDFKI
jgi:hypothetical protein